MQNAAVLLPSFIVSQRAHDEELLLALIPMRTNPFKHACSIMQSMGEDSYARFAQRHILPVEVHNQVRIAISLHLTPPHKLPETIPCPGPAHARPGQSTCHA